MEDTIFDELNVIKISRENDACRLDSCIKPVISEASLKISVNGHDLISLLCLNRQQEELALGFLYNEGVINNLDDIKTICFNDKTLTVAVILREGLSATKMDSLKSITSGGGKSYIYANPVKQSQFKQAELSQKFSAAEILDKMKDFTKQSELFRQVGGVHSLLLSSPECAVFSEDIGRHNCFDKVTGVLLGDGKLDLAKSSVLFISGRVSSEIMSKVIRLGAPVIVSKSTPTTTAVRLANQYNITLLGYARHDTAYIYSGACRITNAPAKQCGCRIYRALHLSE